MYNAIRHRLDCPFEYTGSHSKYQVLLFMTTNAEFFMKYCWKSILFNYNFGLGKQFSYKGYLQYLLERDTWGDENILKAISIMWSLPITLIYPQSLAKHNIRHQIDDIKKVDMLILYSGGVHYSAIGMYTGHLRVF